MTAIPLLETIAGLLLVFFVPGYALAKATFPEWRVRGPTALLRGVELVTLGFCLSVVLTVVAGYGLLKVGPNGFQASWSDPALEAVLAAVAFVAFVVGLARGAYRREPPAAPSPTAAAEEAPWELAGRLYRLDREERRLTRQLARGGPSVERGRVDEELARLREERAALVRAREEEYAR